MFCCDKCYKEDSRQKYLQKQFNKTTKLYEDKTEGIDYVECKICSFKSSHLASHLKSNHKISAEEYRKQFNCETVSDTYKKESSDRVIGESNPGFNHGGKLSAFSDNFLYKETDTKEKAIKASKKTKSLSPHKENTKIEYYLHQGMSRGEAEIALKERQSTFSLEKCIEKYGDEEGNKIWLTRQEKWHKNFKNSNFSQISQQLFWEIANRLKNLNSIFFATLSPNKTKDDSGKNHELRLKLEKLILPDFIDVSNNKIIEFNGTYWHGEVGIGNKKRDEVRKHILLKNGFKVLNIDETYYKKNKEKAIKECINFLTQ